MLNLFLMLVQTSTAIRGVTVIDGTGAAPLRNATVVITGDRIAAVGPRASVQIPAGARVLDLPGRTLVPGFIDMHAHVALGPAYGPISAGDPPLRTESDSLANVLMLRRLLEWGVTTVRNPAGPTLEAVAVRDAVRAGKLPGPRIFTAGALLDVIGAPGGLVETVTSDSSIRAAVRAQAAAGVDYIKLYAGLSPPLVRAGIDEAHKQGIKAIGHLMLTSWTDAARAGIDGIVHIVPGSPLMLPPARRAAFMKGFTGTQFFYHWFEQVDLQGAEIDTAITELVKHNVVLDPTLVTFEAVFKGNDPAIIASPDLATAPAALLRNWRQDFQLSYRLEREGLHRGDRGLAHRAPVHQAALRSRGQSHGRAPTRPIPLPHPAPAFIASSSCTPTRAFRRSRSSAWPPRAAPRRWASTRTSAPSRPARSRTSCCSRPIRSPTSATPVVSRG